MRHILTGSKLVTRQGERRVQNAYSLRCIPQVLGACSQALHYATEKLEIEMNAVTDNPLIFSDTNEIISRGNFHGEPIAFAMDFLKLGIAELASISERRIERLVNPQLNDLPAFLSPNPGLESGAMILQYTAAPLVSENKTLAHPASVDSIPSSANQEDHVSMGTIAARHAHQMLQNTRQVITIELICALEACTYRGPEKLAETTLAFYEKAREIIPEITPGFPANGPGGMHTDTLIEAIEIAAKHPFVKVMDVVEIEPTQDIRDMTSKTAAYLLLSLMNFIVRI